ncbi:glycoside hydrolase family 104 protein [Metapseudomonas resinovorans]|uniref:Lysozyme n=1 Tax=Metapseudomonas resinovorans NBRC 106553 TaxID=1245471 RepID=S6AES2_METRE|nr:glycoside hydrolase family 104 protein [Pseudomonas resinovorans]BAN48282.1 lysozyme [Pseudomonas resinovorans NBRC 106553]
MARLTASLAGGTNVLAFLDMLAWLEGTDHPRQPTKDQCYDVILGGASFTGYADHLRRLVDLPRLGIKSTAAGRYQLLSRYWDSYRKSLKLEGGFPPENQDRVAIQQIRERRALADIKAGRIPHAINKCWSIWASLPGAGYGQNEHSLDDLLAHYVAVGGRLA